jgi:hypothetical protein
MRPDASLTVPLDEADIALLPPVLRRIVRRIGLPKTMALVKKVGGVPTYFPRECGPEHWLSLLVGVAEANAIINELGPGELHTLPRAHHALRNARNRQMVAQLAVKSGNKIAHEHGMTVRRARMIFAEAAATASKAVDSPPDGQHDLFGRC